MPPADNTPDFDSMSPEELMAWMETLAERQGASEGFTTDKRMDIAEVDPTAVEDTGPGYIPYGMTEEQWAKKQADEAAAKAQRAASAPPPAPQPVAAMPEPAAPAPEPQPAAAQGATPDFDSMSPEELMAWMETLAERQGAEIGFTTDKRMNIAEIDPATVEDTGPGYIPYGMTEEQWAKKQAAEAAAKAQRAAFPPPAASAPQPVAPTPEPEPVAAEMPDFSLPQFDAEPEMTTELTTPASEDEAGGGLAWLESLAADQGGDFPQMDLSSLGEEIAPLDLDSLAEAVTPTADVTDPMQWLENLAQTQEEPFAQPVQDELASAPAAPSEASDPLEWLESLAKRQGADPEEFTTRADLDIPVPSAPQPAAPGYTDYVFDEDTVGPAIDMPVNVDELDKIDESDPVAWLESLASQQAFETPHGTATSDEDVSEEEIIQDAIQSDIMAALSGGENVSADAMKDWMDTLLEQGATRSDEIEDLEEDEEIELEAQIPDWLVEQVGPPPDMMHQPSAPPAEPEDEPLLAEVFAQQAEPEGASGIPDWLRDESQDESLSELESIFAAPTAQPAAPPEPEPHTVAAVVSRASDDIEIDPNDPWVEAFELERQQHLQGKDISELLDEVVLDVAAPAVGAVEALQPASFAPENELLPGEAQDVPDWLAEALPDGGAPAQPAFMSDDMDEAVAEGEMPSWLLKQIGMETETELAVVSELDDDLPDWLKEAGVAKTDTVPDWLIETVETGPEEPVFAAPPAPVAPTPAPAAPPPPAIVPVVASPAPVHQAALDPAAAAAALDAARTKVGSGDVQGAILEYEAVVRANTHLDAVIKDLADMVKGAHKHNAAVYRVLGDSLMRHGRLQEALDTYRKALNLL